MSFAVTLLLAQSAFWSDIVSWPLKALVALIGVLAAVRPAEALLVVATLAPLGHALVTSAWHAYPFALSEALVLAFLAGYTWAGRRPAGRPSDELTLPSWLFALVVLASCAVQAVVVQIWHDYPIPYAWSFLKYLGTEYLTTLTDPRAWVDGRGFVSTAALLLEGVALMRAARALCARQPALTMKLTAALVAGGIAVALVGFSAIATQAAASSLSFGAILSERWPSPAIPSVDTAGVYYMFIMFLAIGLATASRRLLIPGVLAAIVSLTAMMLTRTRAAVVASLVVAAASSLWWASRRITWLSPVRAAVASAALAAVFGLMVIVYNPFQILAPGRDVAIRMRVLFAETAVRMMATRPVAGVGIGQYESHYLEFAPPELIRYDTRRNNAHNYFLWIGAELGVAGLGCFLWILGAALYCVWSNLSRFGTLSRSTAAGLAGFIITWLIGQPTSLPQVSYPFWMALGMAAVPTGATLLESRRRSAWSRLLLPVLIVGIVVSVPIRAKRDIAETVDLSRVSYGFYNPGETADHRAFRWAGPKIRFYMRSSARAIELPVAALLPSTPNGVELDVLVNGRRAQHLTLSDRQWHVVSLNTPALPESKERYWQVDLNLTPIGVPPSTPDEERRIAVGDIVISR